MLKKSLVLIGVTAAFYLQAQDISTIRNSIDVYSNTPMVGSSKFNAMVGSNGALGGDATALLTNPAGLGVAIAGDVSATLSITGNKNTSTLAGSSVNYNITKGNIGNASGVAAFQLMTESPWKFINLGASISTQSLENYVETAGNTNVSIPKNLVDGSGNAVVGNLAYLGHAYNRYGTQTKFNLGVGANYNNSLYLGASINMHYADLEQYDSANFGLDLDNTIYSFDKQYTPFSEKSNGFSATLGVIGKITNQFRLGASIETPTWWNIDRIYSDYYTSTDDGLIYYDNFTEDRSFRSPMKATFSGAFVPTKNFAINVDYTLGVTKPKYKVQGDAERELNSFFNDSYKNSSEIKVGAEYRIKALRLRGGYSYASSPFDAMTISAYSNNGQAGDTNYSDLILGERNTIGAGIGYDFGKFYVDAAYQNISSKYKNPFLSGNESFGTGYYSGDFDVASPSSVVSDVKNIRNNFFLTVGWKF